MNLTRCARLAQAAYIQDPGEMLAALPSGESRLIRVPRTETEGFVHSSGVIGFSGTESFRDVMRDAMFLPAQYRYGGWIHHGFRNAIESIRVPVLRAVRELWGGAPAVLTCVGHSLGAELALGVMDIVWSAGHLAHGVTFGCPNGWSRGAARAHGTRHPGRVTHVQNRWDYVTWMQSVSTRRPPGVIQKVQGPPGHRMVNYLSGLEHLGI